MKFGLAFIPDKNIAEVAENIKLAEDCGYDFALVTDENFFRDVYTTLAASALKTKKIKLGTGITNPYTRHPAYTAVAIASLNELSSGRALLGIGAGGSMTLNPVCIERKTPVAAVREAIEVIKGLLGGGTVNYRGQTVELKNAKLHFKTTPIPVYLSCRGNAMTKMGGEVADGVILSTPINYIRHAIELIKEGARAAGRDPDEIEIGYWAHTSVTGDTRLAKDLGRQETAYVIADTPDYQLEKAGISIDLVKPIRQAFKEYDVEKAKSLVVDTLTDQVIVYGSPESCVRRLKEIKDMGVNLFVIGPPLGPDKQEAVKTISKEILPHLR